MFRDKNLINLRLQKGGSVEPPRTPCVWACKEIKRWKRDILQGMGKFEEGFGDLSGNKMLVVWT